jgi:hypothetical protein
MKKLNLNFETFADVLTHYKIYTHVRLSTPPLPLFFAFSNDEKMPYLGPKTLVFV